MLPIKQKKTTKQKQKPRNNFATKKKTKKNQTNNRNKTKKHRYNCAINKKT